VARRFNATTKYHPATGHQEWKTHWNMPILVMMVAPTEMRKKMAPYLQHMDQHKASKVCTRAQRVKDGKGFAHHARHINSTQQHNTHHNTTQHNKT